MAKTKVEYWFDPLKNVDIKPSKAKEALSDIADYIKEEILLSVSKEESPVKNGPWSKPLSKQYASFKKKEVGSKRVDLELSGDMLSALVVTPSKSGIKVTVGPGQQGKADGNNRGTYGKTDKTNNAKARRFIPIGKETFSEEIQKGIEQIIQDYSED